MQAAKIFSFAGMSQSEFKVDFMIIGAMKCGTTTVANHLAKHPDVCFCHKKEAHFFNTVDDWRANLTDYKQLFENSEGKLVGEGTPAYTAEPFYLPAIHNRLYAFNPAMKFIYIMRHPVDRMLSHYMHQRARGFTKLPVEEAIETVPVIKGVTKYFSQISPYINRFGKENVLLLFFDDLSNKPNEIFETICGFLKLDCKKLPDAMERENESAGVAKAHYKVDRLDKSRFLAKVKRFIPAKVRSLLYKTATSANASSAIAEKPVLSDTFRKKLLTEFEEEIKGMEMLTGKNLSAWRI